MCGLDQTTSSCVSLPTELCVKRFADSLCEEHHIFFENKEAAYDATAVRAVAFEVRLCGHHPTKLEKCDKTHCMVRTPNKNASPKCLLHPESGKTSFPPSQKRLEEAHISGDQVFQASQKLQ